MRRHLANKVLILVVLLLMAASLLLISCNALPSDVPEVAEEPASTPEPTSDEGVPVTIEYLYDEEENESEHEIFDENKDDNDDNDENSKDETGSETDSDSTDGFFEIYSIEGTADSITGDRWERLLNWRKNAIQLAENHRDEVIINKNPVEKIVYLTFDDGPDPVNTVSVINTLKEYNVSATFFFLGENVRYYSDVVKKAFDAGFSIGLHGYSHTSFRDLTSDEIRAELNETNDLIEAITGKRATTMRPPYGAIDDEEIKTISDMDLKIYLWSLDTLDWAQSDANEILRNIKEHLRPGEIILMHAFSGQKLVPVILPSIIEFIKDEGFEIKALPQ